MESYLSNRKQFVEVSGKRSSVQEMSMGTPQGSRLSPLLFIILMADLDLWTENSSLSNFADDTQSIIVSDNRENLLEMAAMVWLIMLIKRKCSTTAKEKVRLSLLKM